MGAVAVRIGGLAIAKAPLIDGKKNLVESQTPFLVVVMEVRKNESKEKRTLLSWTYFNDHYSSMFLKDDKELPMGVFLPVPNCGPKFPICKSFPKMAAMFRTFCSLLFRPMMRGN